MASPRKKTAPDPEYVPADGSAPASLIVAATDQAFLIAKDSAFNICDFISNKSMWAFRTIDECEKELDRIERTVDGILPKAITHVAETRARELLACSRVVTELERITDLVMSAAHGVRRAGADLGAQDRRDLLKMGEMIQKMVEGLHAVFTSRDLHEVGPIIRADGEIDRLRSAVFRRHTTGRTAKPHDPVAIFFVAQALERAGDHGTNIAEEAYRLIAGGTLRHLPAREKRSKLGR